MTPKLIYYIFILISSFLTYNAVILYRPNDKIKLYSKQYWVILLLLSLALALALIAGQQFPVG